MSRTVRKREPGFYGDSYRLLNDMCITIFKHQCENAGASVLHLANRHQLTLSMVHESQWPHVVASLTAEPVLQTPWERSDVLSTPPQTEVSCLQYANGNIRFSLLRDARVLSELEIPGGSDWHIRFMRNVGRGAAAHFTVQDWMDEFDLDSTEFESMLNYFYQCGFVVRIDPNFDTMPAPLTLLMGG